MKKSTKIKAALGGAIISASATAIPMLWVGLKKVTYTLESEKIKHGIRIAVISDLHSCSYGKQNLKLLDEVICYDPDFVIFPGDTFDDEVCPRKTFEFLNTIVELFPCFYVTGNHEFYREKADEIKRRVSKLGIEVLCGDTVSFMAGDEEIRVSGLDDKFIGEDEWQRQKDKINIEESKFNLLLSHRPDLFDEYVNMHVDLAVSGHAHGGQLIIPGLLNGLYAPYQGLFPKYAGGLYTEGKTSMIVSRGLMRQSWPRIMNPPELVFIDLLPKKQ